MVPEIVPLMRLKSCCDNSSKLDITYKMVKINRVYTKTGDDGSTGLVGGGRIPKDDPLMEAIGEVDELNSYLGMARTLLLDLKSPPASFTELTTLLANLQSQLFDLGAELATPPSEAEKFKITEISAADISWLEQHIDRYVAAVPELRSFVLPGGTQLNSWLHIARTTARKAERRVIAAARAGSGSAEYNISQNLRIYLNRLSDLLFILARFVAINDPNSNNGAKEFFWEPGKR